MAFIYHITLSIITISVFSMSIVYVFETIHYVQYIISMYIFTSEKHLYYIWVIHHIHSFLHFSFLHLVFIHLPFIQVQFINFDHLKCLAFIILPSLSFINFNIRFNNTFGMFSIIYTFAIINICILSIIIYILCIIMKLYYCMHLAYIKCISLVCRKIWCILPRSEKSDISLCYYIYVCVIWKRLT